MPAELPLRCHRAVAAMFMIASVCAGCPSPQAPCASVVDYAEEIRCARERLIAQGHTSQPIPPGTVIEYDSRIFPSLEDVLQFRRGMIDPSALLAICRTCDNGIRGHGYVFAERFIPQAQAGAIVYVTRPAQGSGRCSGTRVSSENVSIRGPGSENCELYADWLKRVQRGEKEPPCYTYSGFK